MRYTFTAKAPKVSAATSSDDTRPALTCAYYDPAAGELHATDSYIAVRMPVSPDPGDTEGWISTDALERSRKRDAGAISSNGANNVYTALMNDQPADYDAVERLTVASYPRPDAGTPPKLEQLWPEDRDGFTVGLNAGFLKRLADALGSSDGVVHLTFAEDSQGRPNPLRAILVRTSSGQVQRLDGCTGVTAPEGLIMPVRVS